MIKTLFSTIILASCLLCSISNHTYAQSLSPTPVSRQEKQAQKAEKKQQKQAQKTEKEQKRLEKKQKFVGIATQQYNKLQSLYDKISIINKKRKNTKNYNAKLVRYESELSTLIKKYKETIARFTSTDFDPSRKTELQSLTLQSKEVINNIQSEIQSIKKSTKS